jgi:alpha-D-ribose 1-methylphosphonate 5-triphosphate diphosphatase
MIFQQFNLALAGLPAVGGLPGAIRLASRNPARAVGLEDRGEIAAGKRADLTRIAVVGERPVVREVFVRGLRVA